MNYCVYRHIRPDTNQVFYVGIGDLKRPYEKNDRNKHWRNIIKLNPDYKVEILFENLAWEQAVEKEIELIKLYGRINLGTGTLCNLTDGGEGCVGLIRTQEHKDKISKALTGKKLTPEHIQNILKGKGKISEFTRNKMSISHIGRIPNEITREKMSNKQKLKSKRKILAFKYPSMEPVGEFLNAITASRELNIPNHIKEVCFGERLHCGGFYFKIAC